MIADCPDLVGLVGLDVEPTAGLVKLGPPEPVEAFAPAGVRVVAASSAGR